MKDSTRIAASANLDAEPSYAAAQTARIGIREEPKLSTARVNLRVALDRVLAGAGFDMGQVETSPPKFGCAVGRFVRCGRRSQRIGDQRQAAAAAAGDQEPDQGNPGLCVQADDDGQVAATVQCRYLSDQFKAAFQSVA